MRRNNFEVCCYAKKVKVCHICNLGMNGKAVFLCNLLENTDFDKYDITILNYRAENALPIIERLSKLPVKIQTPSDKSNKTFIAFLNDYLNQNKVDVVHSHIWDLSGLFLFIAKKHKVPVRVCHSHNTSKAEGRYNPIKEFVRDKIIWNVLKQMIQHNGNRFVACSEEAAKWLFTKKNVSSGGQYSIEWNRF